MDAKIKALREKRKQVRLFIRVHASHCTRNRSNHDLISFFPFSDPRSHLNRFAFGTYRKTPSVRRTRQPPNKGTKSRLRWMKRRTRRPRSAKKRMTRCACVCVCSVCARRHQSDALSNIAHRCAWPCALNHHQDDASKQVQEEMKVFEEVKSGINVIRRNVQLIDGLKMQSNKTFDQKVFQGAAASGPLGAAVRV